MSLLERIKTVEKKTKTSMVQELLEKNPALKPAEISKILSEKGIDIKNSAISVIKNRLKKKPKTLAKRRMPFAKIAKKRSVSPKIVKTNISQDNSFSDLIAVKDLYCSMGADRIISAIKALEKLGL